jgi:hypothetical protein
VSSEAIPDDPQLVDYLLGLLPEEETERIDEQSIVDDEVAARLRCVENDLVDAYVSGTLEGAILARFESYYLASPRRREKVQFARRLLRAIDRIPASGGAVAHASVSSGEPLPCLGERPEKQARVSARSRFAWSLVAAAMLLLTCGVLLFRGGQVRRGLDDAQRQAAASDGRAQTEAGRHDRPRAATEATANEPDRARAAQPIASIALVLAPQTRAVGPVPVIAVRPGADAVAFDLQLEGIDFARYAVALKDPATNRVLWRSDLLTPRASGRQDTIGVTIPAGMLKPQHYSLDLSGGNPPGALEIVGSYTFQIQSR